MVGVAQLVERQTVDLDVAGSNPVTHPILGPYLTVHLFDLGRSHRYYSFVRCWGRVAQVDRATDF